MYIKFILLFVALLAEVKTILRLRDKSITVRECALWTALWIAVGTVVAVPDIASRVAAAVGVGRGADLVVYAALILLFYAQFRQTVRFEKMEKNITELTRRDALNTAKKP